MAQLTDLRGYVRNRLGLASTDGKASDSLVTELLNAALRQVAVQLDWSWLTRSETITTVAGQGADTPAALWRSTVSLWHETTRLQYKAPAEFQRWANLATGRPFFYTIMNKQIHWAPVPNAAYDIEHIYIASEVTLTSDTDEPDLPDWAIDYLVVLAAHILAGRMGDVQRQRAIEPEMNRLYNSLLDESRRSREPVRVQRRRDLLL